MEAMMLYWIKALPDRKAELRLGGMIASIGLICPEYLLVESKANFSEWLLCDGQFVDCDEYPELFYAVGFIFGLDDGRFRLPFLNLPFGQQNYLPKRRQR